ncbi:NAD-dependent epimerase/dehydratase family protein [Nakamurella sp. YIM 132087]|uniref:NAD-dependent epimerase/dehydratase family protein n=1 Tax=Nakamurella alba TaxID=2665158 RepID=A0A7K1FJ61_9ACTN|nr:NAD-dependent epimerase/dehydratase family protein [Nakamurella alba]MTD14106.1 NAD-dependent epimerase/dehydratase family protein [Nakamurella alba]
MTTRPTWILGAGGLLGGAVRRAALARRLPVLTSEVPWTEADPTRRVLTGDIDRMLDAGDGGWRIAWCAGGGVTGSTAEALRQEVRVFRTFLDDLAARSVGTRGSVFVASSAGALYAGAAGAPFTERSAVAPLAPYGRAKVEMEQAADDFARRTGHRVVLGRIANLYGPGQDMNKGQGLVSHLCRAHLERRPLSVFVPLDTVRDYLFVDDCARMVLDLLDRCDTVADSTVTSTVGTDTGNPGAVVKILASGQGTTIGALLGECRRLFKRTPKVVLGSSDTARFQARDLRLRSVVWPEIDRRPLTTLPAGIDATIRGLHLATFAGRC